MLVGYEANNAMRNAHELGDYSRELIARLAEKHIGSYRALLFSTRIKVEYSKHFSGDSNVSTYVPVGIAKTLPSAWIRYHLNTLLQSEKVDIFHGLNEELPYQLDDNIITIITCYGPNDHKCNSLLDSLLWRHRMKYSFKRADIIVAVSEEVKNQIMATGVSEEKIVVIGASNPLEITDEVVEKYFELYKSLV
jgi:hypothetical protein